MGFAFVAGINGHAAYIFLDMMVTLREIVSRKTKAPFYLPINLLVYKAQSYFSITTLITVGGYILMTLAIWNGPYGITPQIQIWLTFGAFYPLAMFFWTFFQVHFLMQNIKRTNIHEVNKEIQNLYSKAVKKKGARTIEQLKEFMELQDKVSNMKEWPIEIQGTITFIITLITAAIQVFISIADILQT